mgnify:CR=1 FL=1
MSRNIMMAPTRDASTDMMTTPLQSDAGGVATWNDRDDDDEPLTTTTLPSVAANKWGDGICRVRYRLSFEEGFG